MLLSEGRLRMFLIRVILLSEGRLRMFLTTQTATNLDEKDLFQTHTNSATNLDEKDLFQTHTNSATNREKKTSSKHTQTVQQIERKRPLPNTHKQCNPSLRTLSSGTKLYFYCFNYQIYKILIFI